MFSSCISNKLHLKNGSFSLCGFPLCFFDLDLAGFETSQLHKFPRKKLGFGTYSALISQEKLGFGTHSAFISQEKLGFGTYSALISQEKLSFGTLSALFSQ